jgi:cholesterol transport system auxiliary component
MRSLLSSFIALFLIAGCATPQAPVAKAVYDFGPALVGQPGSAAATPQMPLLAATQVPLALADIEANGALEGLGVSYRLAYADAQQLRSYALARWSMPPAQLLRLRLRDALSQRGPVLGTTDTAAGWLLKVELDEFNQVFASADSSSAVVRMRATLLHANTLVAQRSVQAQALAPSLDAAGGVRALTLASDDAVAQLASWVAQRMAQTLPNPATAR